MGRALGLRRKRFRYRDRANKSQADHAAHWEGFEFQAGPVCVRAIGIWGECQCWAASAAEGMRMIRHGLTFGGFNPDDPRQGQWRVTRSRSPRYGQPGRYVVLVERWTVRVSKRAGPSGPPDPSEWAGEPIVF